VAANVGQQVAYTGAINNFPTVYGWANSQLSVSLTDSATSATYVIKATGVMANDGANAAPPSATNLGVFDFRGTANLYNSTGHRACSHGGFSMGGDWEVMRWAPSPSLLAPSSPSRNTSAPTGSSAPVDPSRSTRNCLLQR
jgi:hypothetical protein